MNRNDVKIDHKYRWLLNEPGWYIKEGYVVRNIVKDDGKRTTQRLHVVIARYEWGDIGTNDVHHVNEDRSDNRIENLQLLSRGEHIKHHHLGKEKPYIAERNKTQWMRDILKGNTFGKALRGDKNGNTKVTDQQWLEGIKGLFDGSIKNQSELARQLGVQKTQVGYVLKGKSRTHLQSQILEIKLLYGRN